MDQKFTEWKQKYWDSLNKEHIEKVKKQKYLLLIGTLPVARYSLQLFHFFSFYTPIGIGIFSFFYEAYNLYQVTGDKQQRFTKSYTHFIAGILSFMYVLVKIGMATVSPALLGLTLLITDLLAFIRVGYITYRASEQRHKHINRSHVKKVFNKTEMSHKQFENEYFESKTELVYASVICLASLLFLFATFPFAFPFALLGLTISANTCIWTSMSLAILTKAARLFDGWNDYKISRWIANTPKKEDGHKRNIQTIDELNQIRLFPNLIDIPSSPKPSTPELRTRTPEPRKTVDEASVSSQSASKRHKPSSQERQRRNSDDITVLAVRTSLRLYPTPQKKKTDSEVQSPKIVSLGSPRRPG